MTFTARLNRGSYAWLRASHDRRPMIVVHGVTFRWCPGDDYVTDELDTNQVSLLQQHLDVQIEMTDAAVPVTESAIDEPAVDEPKFSSRRRGR